MLVGLFILLQALPGSGDTIVVTDRVSCRTCRLETRSNFAFGSSLDSTSISAGSIYQMLRSRARETFVLTRRANDAAVLRYDSLGQLRGSLGRRGSGPGEIQSAWSMALIEPDTLVIFDGGLRRMTWLTTTGTYLRSSPISLTPVDGVRLPDGTFVLMAESRSVERAGLLLHHVNASGEVLRSFHEYVVTAGGVQLVLPFSLAPRPDGGFVVFDHSKMLLHAYDGQARRTKIIRRQAEWASRRVATETRAGEGKLQRAHKVALEPFPMVRSVYVDSTGLVWLMGAVDRPGWRAGGKPFASIAALSPAGLQYYWTGIVDVIDPISGQLVYHGHLPFVGEQLRDGTLARPTEDDDGSLRIELHQVALRGLPSPRR